MVAKWYFNQPRPGDKNREPVLGEFFSTEAIKNAAEALVREGMQNALDAAHGRQLVRVRIYISGAGGAIRPEQAARYFEGVWPHIEADGNGLLLPPDRTSPCAFLAFEDFGTTGLDGDPAQWHDVTGVKNPFYYFFRAEGQSSKGEQDRGRWGVGKTVFPRSSDISSYFGLTVRSTDGAAMLMGQSVLKSHSVGSDYYSPDGYWGLLDPEGLTMPVTDSKILEQFSRDFCLKRESESGLSVVVPYCDSEISQEAVTAAVCKDYFYPILAAKLEVTISSPESEICINSETIHEIVKNMGDRIPTGFLDLIDLAEWATSLNPTEIECIGNQQPPYPPEWNDNLLYADQASSIQRRLEDGERLALRVYLRVKAKQSPAQTTHFDIFMERAGSSSSHVGRPLFIRDGIIVSDVYSPTARGTLAIVTIQDKPLATLLGDSENPAHTQWQRQSSHYRGKYSYAGWYIPFVTRSVYEIIRIVGREDEKADPSLLLDFFSVAIQHPGRAEAVEPKIRPGGRKPVVKPNIPVTPRPKSYRVATEQGGFAIKRGSKEVEPPPALRIRVAYDTRRGAPLTKYHSADFTMQELTIDSTGVEVVKATANEIRMNVVDAEFNISVTGFDAMRDLYVDVKPMEVTYDTTP